MFCIVALFVSRVVDCFALLRLALYSGKNRESSRSVFPIPLASIIDMTEALTATATLPQSILLHFLFPCGCEENEQSPKQTV